MIVRLRPWRLQDAADLAAACSNRAVQDNLRDGLPYPYTVADAQAYILAMLAADPSQLLAFAIEADGRAVGSIAAQRQQNIHARTAELGYYVAEEHWGRGIATRAVRQMCGHVFAHTDILRIFAEPFARNAASRRVLEKAGFILEGVLRSGAVKNGVVIDVAMYALVRE